MNFTLDSLHAAESALKALRRFASLLPAADKAAGPSAIFDSVFDALKDDLNTPGALGALFSVVNAYDPAKGSPGDRAAFHKVLFAFGFNLEEAASALPPEIDLLAKKRWEAKKAKDFAAADKLRAELTAAGWSMLDSKDGYKLEPLKKA